VPATLCDGEDEVIAKSLAFAASNVEEIRITTNGSNSFWIDELYLKDALGNAYRHWGGDNNFGYCVSTDGDDGEYSYCYEGEATDELTFTP
jgi:hypothetical protein